MTCHLPTSSPRGSTLSHLTDKKLGSEHEHSPPLATGQRDIPGPQWVPETTESAKPCIGFVFFPCLYMTDIV